MLLFVRLTHFHSHCDGNEATIDLVTMEHFVTSKRQAIVILLPLCKDTLHYTLFLNTKSLRKFGPT